MRIGVMFRAADESGGIGVYARYIVRELLKIDTVNTYVLFYGSEKHMGLYADHANAKEVLIKVRHKALWDQVEIPRACKIERIDIIFHPKFTVPLFTKSKAVLTAHGADWYIEPYNRVYNKLDIMYIKTFMPLYFRKASAVISISQYCTDEHIRALPKYKDKLKTIYFAPDPGFRLISKESELARVKEKYGLPDKFILSVIRYDEGTKNERKNFYNMAKAFAICKKQYGIPHTFIVIGKNCNKYADKYDLKELGIAEDVVFPGYIEQLELPALYNLADMYLYPTIIETFPIPITEAMACGCPIVTSNSTGLKELSGDAAMQVDPMNENDIADAMNKIFSDDTLRAALVQKGLERSKMFSWEKAARQTLALFEEICSE